MTAATLPFRTILVPTDFSRCARRALEYAAKLARASGATLVIQHVTELPYGLHGAERIAPDGRPVRVDDYARESARARLDEEATRLGPAIRVFARSEIGDAVEMILEAAEELGVDLIVMGTHGRTGWQRGLLGSVAERVVRGARCPVLTIRREDDCDPKTDEEHQLDAEVDG
jgi:universal stress protein A